MLPVKMQKKLFKLVKKAPEGAVSLKHFYERRNKVLIRRRYGGFGDILMHRMMFEDFHRVMPEIELYFATSSFYLDHAKGHPFAKALDIRTVNNNDYGTVYDTSTACRVYETKYAPTEVHRSDIWAAHCGVQLCRHNMHLKADPQLVSVVKARIDLWNPEHLPVVAFSPYSTQATEFGQGKSLLEHQIVEVIAGLRARKLFPIAVHDEPKPIFTRLAVRELFHLTSESWKAAVAAADYVVTVDTAMFHMGGGLKKPMTAIFTFTDGMTYGKYYEFILVQKHRKNGNWDCGPCFLSNNCCKERLSPLKPCLTELTAADILEGVDRMLERWKCVPRV